MTWDKTSKEECPECGSALFRHYDRETGETHLVCYKDGCEYKKFVSKRTPRKTKAQKEAEAAAAGETGSQPVEEAAEAPKKKTTRKTAAKKTTAKKTATRRTTKKAETADGEQAPKKRATRKKTAKVTEEDNVNAE